MRAEWTQKTALSARRDPRTAPMWEMYEGGSSLQDVGDRFGLTRERVRQLFAAAGLPTRPQGRTAKLKRARLKDRHAEAICARFLAGGDAGEVAEHLGLPGALVREVLRERLLFAFRHPPRTRPLRYSDAELLRCLREIAGEDAEPLSTTAYREKTAGRRLADGRPWPSAQTIAARYLRWREALIAAGLLAPAPTSRGARPRFDPDTCLQALREAALELGTVPSGPVYAAHARTHKGRRPSYKTVRRHFETWFAALSAAGLLDARGRPAIPAPALAA